MWAASCFAPGVRLMSGMSDRLLARFGEKALAFGADVVDVPVFELAAVGLGYGDLDLGAELGEVVGGVVFRLEAGEGGVNQGIGGLVVAGGELVVDELLEVRVEGDVHGSRYCNVRDVGVWHGK